MLLLIAGVTAAAALIALLTGALVPYILVRNGVYTVTAFLALFSVSLVASYWIDLANYKLRTDRSPRDLKQRITLGLFLLAGACFLLRAWEFQEDRELLEAREAYQSQDYALAKELFLQQRERYWTTDPEFTKISSALKASEANRKWDELSIERRSYSPGTEKYKRIKTQMNHLKSIAQHYPYRDE